MAELVAKSSSKKLVRTAKSFRVMTEFSFRNYTGIPYLIGHRGALELYPENTLISLKSAIEMGIEIIEFDVQMSRDGELIIIHDDTVDRTTDGKGFVYEMTTEEIRLFDAGTKFSPSFAGEKIPILDEVLKLSASSNIALNIEIKNGPVFYENIALKIVRKVLEFDLRDRTVISSFDHEALYDAKKVDSKIKTAPLSVNRMHRVCDYLRELKADGFHPRWNYLTEELISELHDNGYFVNTWIVNEESQFTKLAEWGVDAIGVNNPLKFKKLTEHD
ncbi:MAG: hypothetical protein COS94_04230 [Candidatus Hydrogenedentes bacterium CG07_land_8_20_14_0_80_42_17]|nr:MAG: hypothetical protein COS94_04230 [Candidatus Hydrogenedentes bacterium CG07_land_8_20_14_0_80_42_17]